jgi:hypothetical protein
MVEEKNGGSHKRRAMHGSTCMWLPHKKEFLHVESPVGHAYLEEAHQDEKRAEVKPGEGKECLFHLI